jgi:uncharacterized protein YndB with AHSA1/START domain
MTDRIERTRTLRAPRSKVWNAITTPKDFGTWFGVKLDESQVFTPGGVARGPIAHEGYEHIIWEVVVEQIEPERLFSWRWHPYAIDPSQDYSAEPSTLVEFTLEEVPDGTLLTVVESGFEGVPLERRAAAYRGNSEGWDAQMERIAEYVSGAA